MRIRLLLGVIAWHTANFDFASCLSSDVPVKNYAESIKLFGQKSLQAIYENQPGNLIYSPAGASMALTMLGAGARGETREQIVQGLQISKATTMRDLYNFVKGLKRSRGYELRAANKVFYNKNRTPNNEFIRFTRLVFRAPAQPVDFADIDNASKTMNEWSAKETNNRIDKIIEPGDINGDTELLLLNAIYFKGEWAMPFKPRNTELQDFHVNGSTVRKVQTMWADDNYRYNSMPEFNARFIELPYTTTSDAPGDALSMFVILPDKTDGIVDLIKNFHKIDLNSLLEGGGKRSVTLRLPKFKVESTINLQKPLETLGFVDMFTTKANLAGIIEESQLFVDRVFQKAFIEVNEEGTEAAATTAIGTKALSAGNDFSVDHPFVALIMKRDGTLLFTAVINDPQ